ncbi:hypothetical protein SCHPADRAFT_834965, partial [Schizopora paradoxa]
FRAKALVARKKCLAAERKAKEAERNGRRDRANSQWTIARGHRSDETYFARHVTFHIFRYYNPDYYGVDGTSSSWWLKHIDLHGLTVKEAKEYTTNHLNFCKKEKVETTTIITGKGLHSRGAQPKIQPAILQLLEEMPELVKGEIDSTNTGQVLVEILNL